MHLSRFLTAALITALAVSPSLAAGIAGVPNFVADAVAQTASAHRIDVHHHISPPTWLDAVKSMKKDNPPLANWTIQKTLDDMDKGGVAVAITSPTTPQTFGLPASFPVAGDSMLVGGNLGPPLDLGAAGDECA